MSHFTLQDPAIDHPEYYGGEDNPYEVIKILEHYSLGFHLGSTIKYILRAGRKNPETFLNDLKKARWYLDRVISSAETALTDARRSLDEAVASAERTIAPAPFSKPRNGRPKQA